MKQLTIGTCITWLSFHLQYISSSVPLIIHTLQSWDTHMIHFKALSEVVFFVLDFLWFLLCLFCFCFCLCNWLNVNVECMGSIVSLFRTGTSSVISKNYTETRERERESNRDNDFWLPKFAELGRAKI
jgi:hypothetical protein